jgi:hypothetical protein
MIRNSAKMVNYGREYHILLLNESLLAESKEIR